MKIRPLRALSLGVFALCALTPNEGVAGIIYKTLTIQVYQVCNDAGANCASTGPAGDAYFANETNAIWAQAGISVGFSFAGQIDSTLFSNIDDAVAGDTFGNLSSLYGTDGPSSTIVDMFLVHTVDAGVYGEGWAGMGGLVMAMDDVMAFNGGLGRIDTIAHELGHNFGLVPPSLGGDSGGHSDATHPNYLMASGSWRDVPATLADINPNGLGLDTIPAGQIAFALQSSLLSDVTAPEPASMALTGFGLLAVLTVRRRRGYSGSFGISTSFAFFQRRSRS